MRITISLTDTESQLLDRVAVELYGDRARMQSATVAALIREKAAALFGREALHIAEPKKDDADSPHDDERA